MKFDKVELVPKRNVLGQITHYTLIVVKPDDFSSERFEEMVMKLANALSEFEINIRIKK
tara:strand:- start:2872 stop:3048 length:177 start_codon:yes stop_codon:yes gene_type:complete